MSKTGQETTDSLATEPLHRGIEDMPEIIELPVTLEQQSLQFRPANIRMPPGSRCSIETVEISLIDPACCEEIVVLFRPWNWGEYVKRSDVRMKTAQYIEISANAIYGVFWEADNVREMAQDAMFPAQVHDIPIHGWVILRLVHREQRLAAKRFHP